MKRVDETTVLAEELGFTAKEIADLERVGALEETVVSTYENLINKPAMEESILRHNNARRSLQAHKGFMPEESARKLIHQTGFPTFPKPKGIPESFRVQLSDKGVGMKYVHPTNTHTYIRVMPGKSHSRYPHQRNPYINHRINGKSVDKFGNKVPNDSPAAHIPINEFIYRELL